MKYAAIFAATAAVASAATCSIDAIPACAKAIIEPAISSSTGCATTDYACLCKDENVSKLTAAVAGDVAAKCPNDVGATLAGTQAFCESINAGECKSAETSTTTAAAPTTSAAGNDKPTTTAAPTSATSGGASYPTTTTATKPAGNGTCHSCEGKPTSTPPVVAGAPAVAGSFALMVLGALAAL